MQLIRAVRTVLFYFAMFVLTLFFGVAMKILCRLPMLWCHAIVRFYARLFMLLLYFFCSIRSRIEGLEHLPAGPVVVLAKHQSAVEIAMLVIHLPRVVLVSKRELLRIPLLNWILLSVNYIYIDRQSPRAALRQLLQLGCERLANNFWVTLFPEGTRRAPQEPTHYNIGGVCLAERAGVPVLPVAVNTAQCWPRKSWIKCPGEVSLIIGPPISTDECDVRDVLEQTQTWIESHTK